MYVCKYVYIYIYIYIYTHLALASVDPDKPLNRNLLTKQKNTLEAAAAEEKAGTAELAY